MNYKDIQPSKAGPALTLSGNVSIKVTLSAKSSLILGENKAAFSRECHILFTFSDNLTCSELSLNNNWFTAGIKTGIIQ